MIGYDMNSIIGVRRDFFLPYVGMSSMSLTAENLGMPTEWLL